MSSKSKRQQTMAKRNREHAVEEKRRLKREKKQAARDARNAPEAPVTEGPLTREEAETSERIDVVQ
jgi:hypothetical protein